LKIVEDKKIRIWLLIMIMIELVNICSLRVYCF